MEVSDAVVAGVLTDEWRSQFYPFETEAEVAQHIAYNLVRGTRLSLLDGFGDRGADEAKVVDESWDDYNVEVL